MQQIAQTPLLGGGRHNRFAEKENGELRALPLTLKKAGNNNNVNTSTTVTPGQKNLATTTTNTLKKAGGANNTTTIATGVGKLALTARFGLGEVKNGTPIRGGMKGGNLKSLAAAQTTSKRPSNLTVAAVAPTSLVKAKDGKSRPATGGVVVWQDDSGSEPSLSSANSSSIKRRSTQSKLKEVNSSIPKSIKSIKSTLPASSVKSSSIMRKASKVKPVKVDPEMEYGAPSTFDKLNMLPFLEEDEKMPDLKLYDFNPSFCYVSQKSRKDFEDIQKGVIDAVPLDPIPDLAFDFGDLEPLNDDDFNFDASAFDKLV